MAWRNNNPLTDPKGLLQAGSAILVGCRVSTRRWVFGRATRGRKKGQVTVRWPDGTVVCDVESWWPDTWVWTEAPPTPKKLAAIQRSNAEDTCRWIPDFQVRKDPDSPRVCPRLRRDTGFRAAFSAGPQYRPDICDEFFEAGTSYEEVSQVMDSICREFTEGKSTWFPNDPEPDGGD